MSGSNLNQLLPLSGEGGTTFEPLAWARLAGLIENTLVSRLGAA